MEKFTDSSDTFVISADVIYFKKSLETLINTLDEIKNINLKIKQEELKIKLIFNSIKPISYVSDLFNFYDDKHPILINFNTSQVLSKTIQENFLN